jgi:hypothetical protein
VPPPLSRRERERVRVPVTVLHAASRRGAQVKHPGTRKERLLKAVEEGSVSVEQLVGAALSRSPEFRDWADARLDRWEGGDKRSPTVRNRREVPESVANQAVTKARARFLHRSGVLSVHWGLKRQQGRPRGEGSVVVMVENKLPREALKPRERLPGSLKLRHRGRTYTVPLDVQAVSAEGALQAAPARPDELRPGSHAWVEVDGVEGTLGALVPEDDGTWSALLSGHVAREVGRTVGARTLDGDTFLLGEVRAVVLGPRGDAASAGPVTPLVARRLGTEATGTRELGPRDLGAALWVKVARDMSLRRTYVGDLGVTLGVSWRGGPLRIEELVATTDGVTELGDSGAPAVDWQGRLVGFVVGTMGARTYLMPARRAREELRDAGFVGAGAGAVRVGLGFTGEGGCVGVRAHEGAGRKGEVRKAGGGRKRRAGSAGGAAAKVPRGAGAAAHGGGRAGRRAAAEGGGGRVHAEAAKGKAPRGGAAARRGRREV